jgi:hypothetical protein
MRFDCAGKLASNPNHLVRAGSMIDVARST